MTVLNDGKRANVFIAIIDKGNINNKHVHKEYELIEALDKTMYAIIRKGVNWDIIKRFPWRKVYIFEYNTEIPSFMQLINLEVSGGGFYT